MALRDELSGSRAAAEEVLRIAVIGDVHLQWTDADTRYFNASDYDFLLLVGDLAAYAHRRALATAAAISRLRLPALLIPGNHDGVTVAQLLAEVAGNAPLSDLFAAGQERRCDQLAAVLAPVPLCGYSLHEVAARGASLSLIAARPHSMGGPRLAFRRHLAARYGVRDLEESARRLCALVDQAGERIVFLAHNGPSGLGAARDDIWGCDFRAAAGDFGDPDLATAIQHARRGGKHVVAVAAGHMHQRLKGGGKRVWLERRDGTLYVNAARVPRILRRPDPPLHHHVCLEVRGHHAAAREILVPVPPDGAVLTTRRVAIAVGEIP